MADIAKLLSSDHHFRAAESHSIPKWGIRAILNNTRLTYLIDGVLLNFLDRDIQLPGYTRVIVDEVHETMANTDWMLSLLRMKLVCRGTDTPHLLG